MGFGLSEVLILLSVVGGFASGGDVKLTAPRDTADKAVRYVLPDANVVVHFNVQAGIGSVFGLLEEMSGLRMATASPEIAEALASTQRTMSDGLGFIGKEVSLDFKKDVGTLTVSLSLSSKERMALLVRLRGNFKESKLLEKLTEDATGTYEFKGKTIHRWKDDSPFPDMVLSFADDTTLLLGPKAVIEEVFTKGQLKASKGSRTARLAALVDRRTVTFAMLSLPVWLLEEMTGDEDLQLLAALLGEVDYVFYGAGPGKGLVEVGVGAGAANRQISYLFKAAAGFLDTVRALVDAGAYSILGVMPLIPATEIEPAWQKALSDEEGVLELAAWFKKRFTGKSKVLADARKKTVRLEFDNPAALFGALAPVLAGAGYWMTMAPFQKAEPMYDEELDYAPERQPAIDYLPLPQGTQ